MIKTLEDVRLVAKITDRLRELGIPEQTCVKIDQWAKEQEAQLNS